MKLQDISAPGASIAAETPPVDEASVEAEGDTVEG